MTLVEALKNDFTQNDIHSLHMPRRRVLQLLTRNVIFLFRNFPELKNCFMVNENLTNAAAQAIDEGKNIPWFSRTETMQSAWDLDMMAAAEFTKTEQERKVKRVEVYIPATDTIVRVHPNDLNQGNSVGGVDYSKLNWKSYDQTLRENYQWEKDYLIYQAVCSRGLGKVATNNN